MSDIPLSEVQVVWTADDPSLPPARLVQRGRKDDTRYISSWGACDHDFNEATDQGRVDMLFRQFVHMTAIEGIDAKALHEIFMDIPEYRRALTEFGSIEPEPQAV